MGVSRGGAPVRSCCRSSLRLAAGALVEEEQVSGARLASGNSSVHLSVFGSVRSGMIDVGRVV